MSSTASGTDVTILMPTLNAAAFIDEALSSIQSSDLAAQKRVEVLLLDGGSTDRTLEVARRYEPLIRANVEKDGGLYAALSRGLAMAQGEIVGWLNADDTFTKDGALRVVDALSADPSLDLAYGDYLVVREGSAPELMKRSAGLQRAPWVLSSHRSRCSGGDGRWCGWVAGFHLTGS